MPTLEMPEAAVLDSTVGSSEALPDFTSDAYKDAYSRINAIVIEGEQEAHDNYISIGTLLPDHVEELKRLAKMEMRHKKGFTACGKNLGVEADMDFAREFFAPLRDNFQTALEQGKTPTCLLIQALLIEAFAISAYHTYIPVSDPFARKITEGVVKDEYTHLNYGEAWLKANLESCREELLEANRENLPLIRRMLDQVAGDAAVLQMDKEDLIEDFLIAYQESLTEIGFNTREITRMAAAALVG
ncbi:aldehyde oxygenase (deformylating) [Prochlorococcus sp. MIT 1303]|uniref:aldehyde oxygenase (deformylating) n=1 Tax=Prochlorococcus sp. MIT 1303 TaxID=1723647 RepID=UPI0007B33FA8|nr:aldehyde oxygenase (deformylating) [Prochlorococcus sp. MIT 1303]KZR67406.1 Aldehyde decarbonylase [Prochlorococcus sp. MIT 1303]